MPHAPQNFKPTNHRPTMIFTGRAERPVKYHATLMFPADTGHTVAIFRQINKGVPHTNHDALEFPDGKIVLLTRLYEGQNAIVLTLPSLPKTAAEAETQERVAYVG
jgi:hypothetical protein